MSFEELVPEEFEEQGEEDQEVAEPETETLETGEEEPEVAEPESEKSPADAAFAEMRRRAEDAERQMEEAKAELENLKAQQAARQAAIANMDVDEIDAIAETLGITREEVLENIEREEKQMAEDLATLQKLDPKLKSLDDLGKDFPAYIMAGLTAEQAFYAIRGKEIATKDTPATPPGKIAETTPPERDYFTEKEVSNMTSEEREANWEKIMASLPRWKK